MSARIHAAAFVWAALLAAAVGLAAGAPTPARAEATWSGLEQPVPAGSSWPIGLGNVGDIEFWAPDRGMLITEGHPPTIPSGLWAYNGVEWHEYAEVCGASENVRDNGGRIAWAAPNEFWTVSNGRAGQGNESAGTSKEREPPLEDNTLCRFAGGAVVASYAHPAFEADSYELMHAAACRLPSDCWFGGAELEAPQTGLFQLHWNGSALEALPYEGEGAAIEDMAGLEGRLYEALRMSAPEQGAEPPAVVARSEAGRPFVAELNQPPLYAPGEPPASLDALRLSPNEGSLWGAAGGSSSAAGGVNRGEVTVVRRVRGIWRQLIGPEAPLPALLPEEASAERALLGGEARYADVAAIAAEPGGASAWVALEPAEEALARQSSQRAVLIHVSSEGAVLGRAVLPSPSEEREGVGPKGAAARLTCPQADDCWLATTQGWLFHLAPEGQRELPRDEHESEYWTGKLITFRPVDQGLPQVVPDSPPQDTSGIGEEAPDYGGTFAEVSTASTKERFPVALLSKLHTRLVHGTMLELRFHLAVKARVRLLARRRKQVVAKTATRTFAAGNRELLLRLNRRRWPNKLQLQTHALAPLPTVEASAPGAGSVGTNTESTGYAVLPRVSPFAGSLP